MTSGCEENPVSDEDHGQSNALRDPCGLCPHTRGSHYGSGRCGATGCTCPAFTEIEREDEDEDDQ